MVYPNPAEKAYIEYIKYVFYGLGMKDITTEAQRKNGTEVWELPHYTTIKYDGKAKPGWKPTFAIYESGYVRVLKSHNSLNCYQLNKKYTTEYKYIDIDKKGNYILISEKINKRALFRNKMYMYVFLLEYIIDNYKKYLSI